MVAFVNDGQRKIKCYINNVEKKDYNGNEMCKLHVMGIQL